jgi:hypothetical protein
MKREAEIEQRAPYDLRFYTTTIDANNMIVSIGIQSKQMQRMLARKPTTTLMSSLLLSRPLLKSVKLLQRPPRKERLKSNNAPRMTFYSRQPLFNADNVIIGSIGIQSKMMLRLLARMLSRSLLMLYHLS